MKIFIKLQFLLVFIFLSFLLRAQNQITDTAVLISPYHSLYTHLFFLQHDSYNLDEARKVVPLSDTTQAEDLAIKIKQIYDGKGLYVNMSQIPDDRNYMDSTLRKSIFFPFPTQLPTVYLEKQGSSWVYSNETLNRVDQEHQKVYPFGADLLLRILPKTSTKMIFGLALWQYVGIALLFLVALIIYWVLSRVINPLVKWVINSRLKTQNVEKGKLWKIAKGLAILLVLQVVRVLLPIIQLTISLSEFTLKTLSIIQIVVLAYIGLNFIDIVMNYLEELALKTANKMDEQLIPILRKTAKIIVILGGIITALSLLNVNVTALIAGVSIGGLAIALAAQDAVKNLIGSVMIFLDKPFQVGDWVQGSGFEGTVKEVGFRSTKIQELDTSILSVPNGSMANAIVNNKGLRNMRLFNVVIGVTYDTPIAKIEEFIDKIRTMVLSHHAVSPEPYYIYLKEMADSSLNIMCRVYLITPSFDEELKYKHQILLGILNLAESMGINFAFPSTSVYLEKNEESPSDLPKNSDEVIKKFKADFSKNED